MGIGAMCTINQSKFLNFIEEKIMSKCIIIRRKLSLVTNESYSLKPLVDRRGKCKSVEALTNGKILLNQENAITCKV